MPKEAYRYVNYTAVQGMPNALEGTDLSRIYDRPISCTADPDGRPLRFEFRGEPYIVVEILDTWIEVGQWWAGEPETRWFRVQTDDLGVFELYTPTDKQAWHLYRVFD